MVVGLLKCAMLPVLPPMPPGRKNAWKAGRKFKENVSHCSKEVVPSGGRGREAGMVAGRQWQVRHVHIGGKAEENQ